MSPFLIILVILACSGRVDGSSEVVFGLEKVKLDRIYDPDARPEHLLLVSGSLKLTGGLRGNGAHFCWNNLGLLLQQFEALREPAPRQHDGKLDLDEETRFRSSKV